MEIFQDKGVYFGIKGDISGLTWVFCSSSKGGYFGLNEDISG